MNIDDLLEDPPDFGTLVTSSRRLSRDLLHRYHAQKLKQGVAAWEMPDIVPWSQWLEGCCEETFRWDEEEVLLSPLQTQALWERVIDESPEAELLLQRSATAKLAGEAWDLMHQWQLPFPFVQALLNEDTHAFIRWAKRYARICQEQGWVDLARAPDILARHRLKIARQLMFAGFLELTPQQQHLLDVLKTHGTEVQLLERPRSASRAVRAGFEDTNAEINAAARWIRHLLESGQAGSIGVVVPDLPGLRAAIEDGFDDVLTPASVLPGSHRARPYNLALGRPLAAYSMVYTALQILELGSQALPLKDLGLLVRSPYLRGAETELTRRALLDARLREQGATRASLDTLYRLGTTEPASAYACPMFLGILDRYREAIQNLPKRRAPSAWAAAFASLLAIWGWPGERSLSSEEFQTLAAWRKLLQGLATLDLISPGLSYQEALSRLRRIAREQFFQPESPEVPVQIVGVLEAVGLYFDHLWLMGLHDEIWPGPPQPNPFLPVDLQRRYSLPHASAERELEYATRLTEAPLACASEVVLSYPRRDGERELRPSPLILQVKETSDLKLAAVSDYRRMIYASRQLEPLTDYQAPPVPEGQKAHGGTAIFKDQAACPFRAFARHRLGAQSLAVSSAGLDAAARGTLVHNALKLVWEELRDHSRLCAVSALELEEIIDRSVSRALHSATSQWPDSFTERFKTLEATRLKELIQSSLELERARPGFEVVERESARWVAVGGLKIKTTVDRNDRLPDGRKVVIDYKTGDPQKVKASAWFGERPDEPQLPLYAITAEGDIAACLFSLVRRGQCRWEGLAREGDIVPTIRAFGESLEAGAYGDWQGLLTNWRTVLEKLALAFRAGEARVDPKHNPTTCRYCDLSPLCRIHELKQAQGEEEQ